MLKHCDVCGPGGCDDTRQQGVLKYCDVCGLGVSVCVMFLMFVVQVGVMIHVNKCAETL